MKGLRVRLRILYPPVDQRGSLETDPQAAFNKDPSCHFRKACIKSFA